MELPKLNLPNADLKIKLVEETTQVFDEVRKKYFKLTPEEWVRQNFIHYLNKEKNYPFGLMQVEKKVQYNSLKNRADILIYNTEGLPILLVECKAPNVKIKQDAFNQIAKYNYKLRVKYLVVTNGFQHFCCEMDYKKNNITFLDNIPEY